jgi:hypothetical protein
MRGFIGGWASKSAKASLNSSVKIMGDLVADIFKLYQLGGRQKNFLYWVRIDRPKKIILKEQNGYFLLQLL